jgi:Anti-sigma-K factor rskA
MGAQARRRRPVYLAAVAASVAAAVTLGGFAVTQGMRANRVGALNQKLADALNFAHVHSATLTPVGAVSELSKAGVQECYIEGVDVPMPAPGFVYRVWVMQGSEAVFEGDFVPDEGLVVLRLHLDPSTYDGVLITEEPEGTAATTPGNVKWASSPQLAAAS